jgi:hypothetical protein
MLQIMGPAHLYVVLFGLFSADLEIFARYARYVSIFKWLLRHLRFCGHSAVGGGGLGGCLSSAVADIGLSDGHLECHCLFHCHHHGGDP